MSLTRPILAQSMVELLAQRAAERPGGESAYVFLAQGEEEAEGLGFAALERRARRVAAALLERVAPGERALLLFPPGLDFLVAFFGCLTAGVVAVPAYPPRRRRFDTVAAIAADARPAVVLTDANLAGRLGETEGVVSRTGRDLPPSLAGLPMIAVDRLPADLGDGFGGPPVDAETVAFLQYTSGSTSTPKGVVVRHGNLLHNEEMILRAFGQSEDSVVVSWLPLYHDMGLIGGVLQPLYCGGRCILMSPMAFLQRPRRWLEAVTRYGATTSGGPNFAYDLCVDRVPEDEREGLDLSSWRVAFNGSEPVRAATLRRFTRAFSGNGFSGRAFYPCYGLAEGTLLVTGGEVGDGPVVRDFDTEALRRGRGAKAGDTGEPRSLVSSGRPWMDQRVAVVDPQSRRQVGPGVVGEIWVAGPSVADAYWRLPEVSADTFSARLADEADSPPFLRTGDLGFFADGELYVTGRRKDLIIVRGRNYHPHDLERTAEAAHPDLRPAGAAAFGLEREGGEGLVLVAEISRHAGAPEGEIAGAVRAAIGEVHGISVHEIVFIRSHTLPKTSSGKVRRSATRDAWRAGALAVVSRHGYDSGSYPPEAEVATAEGWPAAEDLKRLPAGECGEVVRRLLRSEVAALTGTPDSALAAASAGDAGPSLVALGLDSLAAVQLSHRLEGALGVPVTGVELMEGGGLEEWAGRLAQRLALAASADPDADDPAPPAVASGFHPLSPGQEAIWFMQRLAPESGAYHVSAAFRFVDSGGAGETGALDEAALVAAVRRGVERHPMLRATFRDGSDGPVFEVGAEARVDLRREDARHLDPGELADRAAELAAEPFDLTTGPLLRLVFLASVDGPVVVVVVHHLVSDFWSMALLARELGALYRAARGEAVDEPPPPLATYLDHVEAQRESMAGAEGRDLVDWWHRRMSPPPPRLELPRDRPRPQVPAWRGAEVVGRIPALVGQEARSLARQRGCTVFHVVLAAYFALLGRYTGQRDLVVGSPVAGRRSPGSADVVGYFVQPLPLRVDVDGDAGFGELTDLVRDHALQAVSHQGLPLARLAEGLDLERGDGQPLFQTLFVWYQGLRSEEQELATLALGLDGVRADLGGLRVESFHLPVTAAQFDLSLAMTEVDGELAVSFRYDRDLFDVATVRRLADSYARLLEAGLASPATPTAHLPLLSPEERRMLVSGWNSTSVPGHLESPAGGRRIPALVAEQAARTPSAPAVRFEGEEWSYEELWSRVRRLASALRGLGVAPEVRVGVLADRSPELLAGLLAVMEAGGAYVPLSPEDPVERLRYLASDALGESGGRRVVLTQRRHAELASELLPEGSQRLLLDAPESWPAGPESWLEAPPEAAAYVIYTSGSTGRPKGVVNGHRGVVNRLRWGIETFPLGPGDRLLQKTPVTFDVSVWELFWPLSVGACLVMARPGGHREPDYLVATVRREGLDVLHFVPSLLRVFLEQPGLEELSGLRTVFTSGEALTPDLVARFHERLGSGSPVGAGLHNLYGPTEGSIEVSWWRCDEASPASVPIGHPIANLQLHVLDRSLQPVPVGVSGELYLGGVGVVRGYLGRPGLTATAFVPDPLAAEVEREPGARLYRTGDLCRRRGDGAVEYLGRIDRQVKVRGFRIELGEVEAVLSDHPAVRETVVDLLPGGEGTLAAWVVLEEGAAETWREELSGALESRLPPYMVPSAWTSLDALPLTASGKLDRRALPSPSRGDAGESGGPPRGEWEERVAAEWHRLLEVERVGRRDDFFALGGHSLLAIRLLSRLRQATGVEVAVRDFFAAPTVAGVARHLEEGAGAAAPRPAEDAFPPVSREGGVALSFAQERMWMLDRLEPGNARYHMPAALELSGPLDRGALEGALRAVVVRHEVLRTRYEMRGEVPVQVVEPAPERQHRLLPWVDLAALPPAHGEPEAERLRRAAGLRPFDLARGPVCRFVGLRRDAGEAVVVAVFHHIAFDGGSVEVAVEELATLYGALAGAPPEAPVPSPLPPPAVQYADYAGHQRRAVEDSREAAADLAYWRQRLADLAPALELPTDRPHDEDRPRRAGRVEARPGAAAAAAVSRLARRCGATPFHVWLAAWAVTLGRHSGTRDLAVGVPASGRDHPALERAVGFYVDTLVVRVDFTDDPSFADLVTRVRDALAEAQDHRALPFERLVEELSPERHLGRTPLIQTLLVADETPRVQAGLELAGLRVEPLPTPALRAKYELTAMVAGTGSIGTTGNTGTAGDADPVLSLEYDADLFDPSTAEALADRFLRLLARGAEEPDSPAAYLPLLSPEEWHRLVVTWNDNADPGLLASPAGAVTIPGLVAEQVARTPDATAVSYAGRELSYAALWSRVRRLASALRGLGVGPDARVGFLADRSLEMTTGLLAIMEAGGTYVPLSPEDPVERLHYLASDALEQGRGPRVVLTQRRHSELAAELMPEGSHRLLLDEPESWPAGPASWPAVPAETAAYVIYTSGSTGRPKGVVNGHRQVVNRIRWMMDRFELGPGHRTLQKNPVNFDVSVWELFWPLAEGACLVMVPPGGHREPAQLLRLAVREGVSFLHFVSSMLRVFLEQPGLEELTALRRVFTSGEEQPPELAARFHQRIGAGAQGVELHNTYGPTETSIEASWWPSDDPEPDEVPIGHPMANDRFHLLDGSLQPVPPGVAGELYIGGACVARGYHGRPGRTASVFLPDPFAAETGAPGDRLYRSGDLCRQRRDGAFVFLGRVDRQVKVRGFRIELGEVEAALLEQPGVLEAVVDVVDGAAGEAALAAWLVPAEGHDGDALKDAVKSHLEGRLPAYMVPAFLIPLEALPLTANGKLDRRALPSPAGGEAGERGGPPRDEWEARVAAEWRRLLEVERVGRLDDFFALGGHSLLAIRLLARLRQATGVEVSVREMFAAPTVAATARLLRRAAAEGGGPGREPVPPLEPVPREGHLPLSFAQEGMWLQDRLEPGNPVYNGPRTVAVDGPLDAGVLAAAMDEIVRRHESLRTVFVEEDGRPVQRVRATLPRTLRYVDLAALPAAAAENAARSQARAGSWRPFDLARGPLLRVVLWRLAPRRHLLLVNLHHMVSDAWSGNVLMRELAALYTAFAAGRPSPLPELPVQYADFAVWQRRFLSPERRAGLLSWWRRRLGGGLEPQRLPIDRPEPQRRSLFGGRRPVRLEAGLVERLRELAHGEGASLFMVLLAALAATLFSRTGQDDQVIGTDMVNRDHPATEGMIGFFIDMLALRVDVSGNPTFRDLLARARDMALGAFAHKALPFDTVVDAVRPERRAEAQSPLFRVVLVLDNTPPANLELPGLEWREEAPEDPAVVFDLTLWLRDTAEGLEGYWAFRGDVFDGDAVDRLHAELAALLGRAAKDPDRRLDELAPAVGGGRRRRAANLDRLRRVRRRREGDAP